MKETYDNRGFFERNAGSLFLGGLACGLGGRALAATGIAAAILGTDAASVVLVAAQLSSVAMLFSSLGGYIARKSGQPARTDWLKSHGGREIVTVRERDEMMNRIVERQGRSCEKSEHWRNAI